MKLLSVTREVSQSNLRRDVCLFLVAALMASRLAAAACGADWPQFRYDAAHTAKSPEELPTSLHLAWSRVEPRLTPAWPDQPLMRFDAAYEPVVAGESVFVSSSITDSITCWNLNSGEERWRYITSGPVRFPPVVSQGRVFAVSDDGYLYCLAADDGKLLWRFRGGLDERRILGNERLISMWPARGAPVVVENTVHFAASIWPFMGVFIHALDVESGEVRWTNDGDGSLYIKQPHMTDSFAGVAPQGVFAAVGDRLLIPSGRSIPACYDRHTGKLQHYLLGENSKKGGGTTVGASSRFFVSGGGLFSLESGKHLATLASQSRSSKSGTSALTAIGNALPPPPLEHFVIAGETVYGLHAGKLSAWTIPSEKELKSGTKLTPFAAISLPGATSLIQAGAHLVIGADQKVFAIPPPQPDDETVQTLWQVNVEGTPASLIAANGHLLVSTLEGHIFCFRGEKQEPTRIPSEFASAPAKQSKETSARIEHLLQATTAAAGYAVVWGWNGGEVVRALARSSQLHIVVIEPQEETVAKARQSLLVEGLYGRRVAVLHSSFAEAALPAYCASLMVTENLSPADAPFLKQAFQAVRPYGGAWWVTCSDGDNAALKQAIAAAELPQARLSDVASGVLITRPGPLAGAADWTHEHADAANTRVSRDSLVKAPLGLLWFGGTSNEGILPRHGHGPQPQVCEGRLFIEGMDMLRAIDIYTGRLLWEAKLPGVGSVYDNLAHQAGANATGANYISTPDGIYVVVGEKCLLLSTATGQTLREFTLPAGADKGPPRWGYINVAGDYLIAGSDPNFNADLDRQARGLTKKWMIGENDNLSGSRALVVMERHTGKVLWQREARCSFRHNGICVGGGRLYALDRHSGAQMLRLSLKAKSIAAEPRLVAFDLQTGDEVWSSSEEIFGTWLSYSEVHDVLVEAGRLSRDTLLDEPKGMRAWQAATGKPLWFNKSYIGPAMIHGDLILKEQNACDLLTGKPRLRLDPITGQQVEWGWTRTYGCNTPMASQHLLTFRSGAAGYCDFSGDGGTSNLGGFRSSCTNNLVVAGGVLCAPDYTRTCTCSYQNQTSIGLIHMPGVETWTSFGKLDMKPPVRRLGVNLGAPGDRKSADGTLWIEAPSVGGASPVVQVKVSGKEPQWFRRHEGQFSGELPWVAASGVIGAETLEMSFPPPSKSKKDDKKSEKKDAKAEPSQATPSKSPAPMKKYTLRLIFAEPENVQAGERMFDVAVQGKGVAKGLDIVREAGGIRKSLVKQIRGVNLADVLTITLTPKPGSLPPVLSGWQLQAEDW